MSCEKGVNRSFVCIFSIVLMKIFIDFCYGVEVIGYRIYWEEIMSKNN